MPPPPALRRAAAQTEDGSDGDDGTDPEKLDGNWESRKPGTSSGGVWLTASGGEAAAAEEEAAVGARVDGVCGVIVV